LKIKEESIIISLSLLNCLN